MPAEKISFTAADLDKLEPGTISISAPSFKDVLQVIVLQQDDIIPLDISVEEGSVLVKRVDDHPLQVALTGNLTGDHQVLSHPVFQRPQDEVHFRRREDKLWELEDDCDVIDGDFRIGVFADIVGYYGLRQQIKERKQLLNRFYDSLLDVSGFVSTIGQKQEGDRE